MDFKSNKVKVKEEIVDLPDLVIKQEEQEDNLPVEEPSYSNYVTHGPTDLSEESRLNQPGAANSHTTIIKQEKEDDNSHPLEEPSYTNHETHGPPGAANSHTTIIKQEKVDYNPLENYETNLPRYFLEENWINQSGATSNNTIVIKQEQDYDLDTVEMPSMFCETNLPGDFIEENVLIQSAAASNNSSNGSLHTMAVNGLNVGNKSSSNSSSSSEETGVTYYSLEEKRLKVTEKIFKNGYVPKVLHGKKIKKDYVLKVHHKCPKCEKFFQEYSCLIVHIQTHHESSTIESNQEQNINIIRDPLRCQICHKMFKFRSHLKRHELSHPKKAFQCAFCFVKFSSSSSLRCHERNHTREMPFQCFTCSKSFTLKSTLRRHNQSCIVDKPFQCSYCSEGFSHSIYLKVHERSHEG